MIRQKKSEGIDQNHQCYLMSATIVLRYYENMGILMIFLCISLYIS